MNIERESIARKLRALRERTTAAGCTEAEATQAAEMYTRLVMKYDLSMTDIEIGEQKATRGKIDTQDSKYHAVCDCLVVMAALCDCKVWTQGPRVVHFIGLPEDAQAFKLLYTIIRQALDLEWFMADVMSNAQYSRRSFQQGMAESIVQRLKEIQRLKAQEQRATGRDLVVVKGIAVREAFAATGIYLSPRNAASYSGASIGAGRAAGKNVILNPRVEAARRITQQG
jgi:hypothetical protein